jgi:hypothetical protein
MKHIGLEWWVECRFAAGTEEAAVEGTEWGQYEGADSRIDAAFICACERKDEVEKGLPKSKQTKFRQAGYRGKERVVICRDAYTLDK